jgi:hypothetical protein
MNRLAIIFMVLFCHSFFGNAQVIIGQQSFDGATPTLTYSSTNGGTITGSSGTGDRPASSTYFTSSNTAFAASNTNATLTFNNVTGLASYTSKFLEFKLASWSIASTGNGADAADLVNVDISTDGGTTFSNELQVNGNSNAYWHYSTGTGLATTVYDGNNTPTLFTPAGGGNRTTDGYSTVHIDLPNGCSQVVIRIRMLNNSTNERWSIDDLKLMGTLSTPCTPTAAPTTNSNSISSTTFCTSAQLAFTPGNGTNHLVILSSSPIAATPTNSTAYSANSTFGTGSAVGSGNYVVSNGTNTSLTITGLSSGTTYYVSVIEYNYSASNCDESYLTTSVLTGSFTTQSNCSTPQVRSILADACSTQEGLDELVIIENGANALSINDISIGFPSGGTFCNTACGTNTFTTNPTYINQLNTLAGCALFTYADPIPAGGIIVVFTGSTPSYVFDYSSQCPSSQQYYAIFCNNTSIAGRFANSGTGSRTLTCNFAGTSEVVSYLPNSLLGDGSFIDFDDPGNATYRVEPNCVYPLGTTVLNWHGASDDATIQLQWETIIESATVTYEVYKLIGGQTVKIGALEANLASPSNSYQVTDVEPVLGPNYYQLKQIDRNGFETWSPIIAIAFGSTNWNVSYQSGTLLFNHILEPESTVQLLSLDGKQLGSFTIDEKTSQLNQELPNGLQLALITQRNGKVIIARIMVQN